MESTQTRIIPAGAYLIFGLSGSGKTTLADHLTQLGYHSIDTDLNTKLSGWVNLRTGRRLTKRADYPYTQDWLSSHRWQWNAAELNRLLKPAATEPVFICGGADQIERHFSHFKKVFALHTDNTTLRQRLTHRDPVRWNNHDPELGIMLKWNQQFISTWSNRPVVLVDSTNSVDSIANNILSHLAT